MTVVGCKTKPQRTTNIPRPPSAFHDPNMDNGLKLPTDGGVDTKLGRDGIAPVNAGDYANYKEEREILKAQTIYFDFDKSSIKTSEQSKLDEVANYLKSNASAVLKVEGNCDSRGTEEYNRSLGERRALGAREYLSRLGVDPSKIVTITNGSDKPAEQGNNEAAYSKNRRDEFVVLTPPKVQ